ncbi:MAG: isoprenylcysteine carboxylmethyltransferase family protein [Acidobacteria bacterium]|nr:isoprenylcysteine carboxylmethyltransferase family protein [Acidobacteriota bacterium]
MASKNKKLLQKYRVPFGFLFGILFLVFARPTINLMIIGGVIAIIGLFIRGWASGHIQKNKELAVSGPYAFTRNPLYFGSFFMGLGFSVAAGVWWIGLLFVILYLGIYFPVMSVESGELTDIFGDKYREYADKVSLFFPWFSSYRATDKRFDIGLYLRYREYQATLGVIFAWAVLALKAFFIK